ncbi:diguanylate cyclase [Absiella sp. AM29-15]|nr:diguanylate cyclase [Absiella sp. AM29-15]RGC45059.1 diguanylate cyclase [Absiella sp. AM29-15]
MDIVLNGEIIHVSITFGISDSDNENDLNKLIEIADDHLYIGKKEGRDRIILEDE